MKQITIAIVDNWRIFREGISLMLKEEDYTVVTESKGMEDLIMQLSCLGTSPSIFIVNAALLIEDTGVVEKLKLGWPETKIVAYDPNEDQPSQLQIEHSGIDKYISKDEDFERVLKDWLLENSVNLISG